MRRISLLCDRGKPVFEQSLPGATAIFRGIGLKSERDFDQITVSDADADADVRII